MRFRCELYLSWLHNYFKRFQGVRTTIVASTRLPGLLLSKRKFTSAPRVTLTPPVEWARRVLKVSPGVTAEGLKEAYRVAAVASHPDRHPPERKLQATREFQRCSEAFAILLKQIERDSVTATMSNAGGMGYRSNSGFRSSSGGNGGSSSGGSSAGGRQQSRGRYGINADRLFRETFGSLSDAEVLSAILNRRVGENAGMGMLSLRRITGQITGGSGSTEAAAGSSGVGHRRSGPSQGRSEPYFGGNPARGCFYSRFSWRP